MRYIKTFEQSIDDPKIGDYVVCDIDAILNVFSTPEEDKNNFKSYLDKNLGKCVDTHIEDGIKRYVIQYNNLPYYLRKYCNYISTWTNNYERDEENCESLPLEMILFWSKDKEECEAFKMSKKFNL